MTVPTRLTIERIDYMKTLKTTLNMNATSPLLVDRMNDNLTTIVQVGNTSFGGSEIPIIAGPCAVENEEQMIEIACSIKNSGASMLRGGAYKPRTSPYSFQGLEEEGLKLLLKAKNITGLPIVTELTSIRHIELFEDVDMIQIGARNMYNYDLLKEVGRIRKPVMLKRGLSATIEEWLMSAEYILSEGNDQVVLCERGIRSYDTSTRNTLDLASVPLLQSRTHLPVIVDPSHGTGVKNLIEPMAKAAIAAGAQGIVIEVHNNPENALSDGPQSLTLEDFDDLMDGLKSRIQFEQQIRQLA